MVVRQNVLSTIMLKNVKLSYKILNCTWQHQKYARPETYLATHVVPTIASCNLNIILEIVIYRDTIWVKSGKPQIKADFFYSYWKVVQKAAHKIQKTA